MKRAKVYELTGKAPTFAWRKVTIRQAVYEALKELKRADVPKIVGTMLEKHPIYSKQKDRDKQIQFTLWQFTREGVVRSKPDRRWRPREEVLDVIASPKKAKRRKLA